jgi:hypothetical protein
MSVSGFFIALLVVNVALIVFLLIVVCLSEGRFSGTGTTFGAVIFLAVGLLGLWKVKLALLHHTVVQATTGYTGTVWMEPWQALVAYSLILAMGLVLLRSAIRRRRS